jgi:hypothetical protein
MTPIMRKFIGIILIWISASFIIVGVVGLTFLSDGLGWIAFIVIMIAIGAILMRTGIGIMKVKDGPRYYKAKTPVYDDESSAFPDEKETVKTDRDNNRRDYSVLNDLFDEFSSTTRELRINSVPLKIEYGGGREGYSIRDIDIKKVERGTNWDTQTPEFLITAFCHYRNANRTFMVSRIISAEANGKKTDVVSFLYGICKAGEDYDRVRAIKRIRDFLKEYTQERKEVTILSYIARIDGTFSKKERSIIANYILENNYIPGMAPEYLVEELNNFEPSTRLFKMFIKGIEVSEKFYETAKTIAGKDSIRLGAFNLIKKPSPGISDKGIED